MFLQKRTASSQLTCELGNAEVVAVGLMIAEGHRHLATLGHLLHTMPVHDPTAVNTLHLQRESSTLGLFLLERKGGHTHNLLLESVPHFPGVVVEVLLETGLHPSTVGQRVQAHCHQGNLAIAVVEALRHVITQGLKLLLAPEPI